MISHPISYFPMLKKLLYYSIKQAIDKQTNKQQTDKQTTTNKQQQTPLTKH